MAGKTVCEYGGCHAAGTVLATAGVGLCHRLTWLLLVVACFVLCAALVQRRVEHYLNHPTTTKVTLEKMAAIPAPAITICNNNELRYSKYTAADILKFHEQHFHIADVQAFITENEFGINSILNHILSTLRNSTSVHQQTGDKESNYRQLVARAGHQLEDIVRTCTAINKENEELDCLKFANFMTTRQIFPYGNCFTINTAGSFDLNKVGYVMSLGMDFEIEEYNMLRYGYRRSMLFIQIHPANELADMRENKVIYFDGLPTSVGISSVKKVENLPKPYSDCEPDSSYSQQMCEQKCLAGKVVKELGCVLYDQPGDYPVCDGLTNINSRARNISLRAKRECKCAPACQTWHYNFQVTKSSDLVYDYSMSKEADTAHAQTQPSWSAGRQPVLKMVEDVILYEAKDTLTMYLYNNDMFLETHKQQASYTLDCLLAEVGGLVAVMLGVSIMSTLNFLHMLCLSTTDGVMSRMGTKRKKSTARILPGSDNTLKRTLTTLYVQALDSLKYDEPLTIARPEHPATLLEVEEGGGEPGGQLANGTSKERHDKQISASLANDVSSSGTLHL